MKVGLILCDHVHPDYVKQFGNYPTMFSDLFPDYHLKIYDVTKLEFPNDIDECDAYMGTGSKFSVYDSHEWITETLKFVRQLYQAKKCFVGVCFSHQLIGQALGGEVTRNELGWSVGVHRFDPLGFNLLMMCQDHISSCPPQTKVIASTPKCPNAMIQVGEHFLGVQAHPEFTKAYDRVLMENRVDRMGQLTVEQGIQSLDIPVHREEIKAYISAFILNNQR
ncbi:type 1 glutamine amidotransferase [Portibacter marinus]|uniref:type 1 glutamine amidotransferase n=1 Tax=Portibacter marinus TaxID=2898660 RepID=UPI001F190AEE|nr:type 1 glutamine amidotransferase [Portibacter marinus]